MQRAHVFRNSSGVILVASLAIALLRRWPALDPPSLWLDDQWVALALRQCSLAQLYALQLPTPIGFAWLEQLAMRVSPDPEWPLQLVPFAFGLLEIAVVYALARSLVRQRWVLALTCLLAACHPVAELYATRVKQYSLDMVVCSLLLLGFVRALEQRNERALAWLALCGLLATPLAFSSVFVSMCLVHVFALACWLRERPSGTRALTLLGTVGLFDLGLTAIYIAYLAQGSNPALRDFWQDQFLHVGSLHGVLTFLNKGLFSFVRHALSAPLLVLLPFVLLGGRALNNDPTLRPVAWAALGLFFGLIVASALQIYPMGAERTGLFVYPFFWLLAAVGLDRVLPAAPALTNKHGRYALAICVYVAAFCLVRPPVAYSDVRDRDVVLAAVHAYRAGDGLLMQPYGALALAYYGGKPARLEQSLQLAHHFETFPEWPRSLVVPRSVDGSVVRDHPEAAQALVSAFFRHGYPRVLYISTHATEIVDALVIACAQRSGYTQRERHDASARARLFVFARNGAAP